MACGVHKIWQSRLEFEQWIWGCWLWLLFGWKIGCGSEGFVGGVGVEVGAETGAADVGCGGGWCGGTGGFGFGVHPLTLAAELSFT